MPRGTAPAAPGVRRGDRTPPHGVEERIQALRIVETVGMRGRERGSLHHSRSGLDFPQELDGLVECVILDRGQRDEVLRPIEVTSIDFPYYP